MIISSGMRGLLIVTALNQVLFWADNDCLVSYLRTEVVCNNTNLTAHDSHSPDWSGSSKCHDKQFVLDTATKQNGIQTTITALVQLVVYSFLGAMSDSFGRRPLILASLFGWVLNMALLWFNAAFAHHFYIVAASTIVRNMMTGTFNHNMPCCCNSCRNNIKLSHFLAQL